MTSSATFATENGVARKRVIRSATVSALCAAALVGLATAPAQADDQWLVRGPVHLTETAAAADKPITEAECRRQRGLVRYTWVYHGLEGGPNGQQIFYSITQCYTRE